MIDESVPEDRILTVQRALQIAELDDCVELQPYTLIEDAAAEKLSEFDCCVELLMPQLRSISETSAKSLAARKGRLSLGIRQINNSVAEQLANHVGLLELHQLQVITSEMAKIFAKHQGNIDITWRDEFSVVAAEILGEFIGDIIFEIYDFAPETLGALIRERNTQITGKTNETIEVHGFSVFLEFEKEIITFPEDITEDQIEGIAFFLAENRFLKRPAIKFQEPINVTEEVAGILSKYKGDLEIEVDNALTVSAADLLAEHQGKLTVGLHEGCYNEYFKQRNGNYTIPFHVVESLAKHPKICGEGDLKKYFEYYEELESGGEIWHFDHPEAVESWGSEAGDRPWHPGDDWTPDYWPDEPL